MTFLVVPAVAAASTALLTAAASAAPAVLHCPVDANTQLRIGLERDGRPRAIGASVVAGTRDCEIDSAAPPLASDDGKTWHFDKWRAPLETATLRASLSVAAGGYLARLDPPLCNNLALPAEVRIEVDRCRREPDRDAALDDAVAAIGAAVVSRDVAALAAMRAPRLDAAALERALDCVAAELRDRPPLRRLDRDSARLGRALGLAWRDDRWQIAALGAACVQAGR